MAARMAACMAQEEVAARMWGNMGLDAPWDAAFLISISLNQHFRRNRQLLVQCSHLLHRKPTLATQHVMDALP